MAVTRCKTSSPHLSGAVRFYGPFLDLIFIMVKMIKTDYPVFLMVIYNNFKSTICNTILDNAFNITSLFKYNFLKVIH